MTSRKTPQQPIKSVYRLTSLAFVPMVLLPMAHSTWAAPTGGNVVSGAGSISASGNTTTINQSSQNMAIDWSSFNINAGETVNFVQPNVSAIALNRDFSGSASQLFGNLNANGHVFLMNTAGVLIGSGANINVGSLLVSDMMVSDTTMQNFGSGIDAGTLTFTDEDLNAGGITHLGSIQTVGPNGTTFLAQYVHVGGDIQTTNGDLTFKVGGSAVLVTDPDGLYGIELTAPVSNDISGTGELLGYIDSVATIQTTSGDIVRNVQYQSDLDVTPVGDLPVSGNITVLTINGVIQVPVVEVIEPPVTITPVEETDIDNTIVDSLTEEVPETSSSTASTTTTEKGSLDNIMEDCVPQDPSDRDCIKQNAIKRYLGKLLIGGSLPD